MMRYVIVRKAVNNTYDMFINPTVHGICGSLWLSPCALDTPHQRKCPDYRGTFFRLSSWEASIR